MGLAHKDKDSATIRQVKDVIAEDLRNWYEAAQMLNMCAFLDPQFKKLVLFIPEGERKDVTEEVKLELLSLAKKQCHAAGSPHSPVSNHSGESLTHSSESEGAKTLEQEQPPTKRLKPGVVSSLFADIATARSSKKPSTLELVESELNRYEQEELLDLDSDPLLWWKTHQVQYPSLSQLLKQLWSLPATSVQSEEIFSSAGSPNSTNTAFTLTKESGPTWLGTAHVYFCNVNNGQCGPCRARWASSLLAAGHGMALHSTVFLSM